MKKILLLLMLMIFSFSFSTSIRPAPDLEKSSKTEVVISENATTEFAAVECLSLKIKEQPPLIRLDKLTFNHNIQASAAVTANSYQLPFRPWQKE